MKIVAKEKDYYDSAQYAGVDETLVYVRTPYKVNIKDEFDNKFLKAAINLGPRWGDNRWRYNADEMKCIGEPFIIGFCGKIFPGVELQVEDGKDSLGHKKFKTIYAYSYKNLIALLEKHKLKAELAEVQDKTAFWGNNKKATMEFFNLKKQNKKFEKFFVENKIPIFIIVENKKVKIGMEATGVYNTKTPVLEGGGLIANINLKDHHFFENIDAYTAYQEISMYLGGVIPRDTPEMATISDENMLKKKGFITPQSFRSMPDTRKRKQKKGKIKS